MKLRVALVHVALEVAALCKGLEADGALVRPLSRVGAEVCHQVARLCKLPGAVEAVMGTFASVDSHVLRQRTLRRKRFGAHGALERAVAGGHKTGMLAQRSGAFRSARLAAHMEGIVPF